MTMLTVGDLSLELRWSPRRRTVEITIERDGSLVLKAPEGTEESVLEDFVREKRMWVYTKLAEKDALTTSVPEREYVSGEGFHYLGRSYRLLLVDEQEVPVKLVRGRLQLRRSDVDEGRKHLVSWYTEHARPWLAKRVKPWARRMGVEPAGVEVRDLGHRWGSCGHAGNVNFHWKVVTLPPSIIDYVVVHELAHLEEPNHTPEFWSKVERTMADFETRKRWLAENGVGYAAV